jgi:hypothetical protein
MWFIIKVQGPLCCCVAYSLKSDLKTRQEYDFPFMSPYREECSLLGPIIMVYYQIFPKTVLKTKADEY